MSACIRWRASRRPIADLVLLHDLSFIDRRSQDTRRYLVIFIAGLGADDRADHRRRRADQLARLGVRRARPAARRRPVAADGAPCAELAPLAADLRRACAISRTSTDARSDRKRRLEPRTAARAAAARSCAATGDRRLEPGAVHPRASPPTALVVTSPGERPRHRARAGDARLLRHVGRARQRRRRPRAWSTRTTASACRRDERVRPAPRLAVRPRRSRATTTASPTRGSGRSATSPTRGRCSANPTGSSTAREPAFADAVVDEARSEDPIVLVQDYHFALAAAMIREALPARDHAHRSGTSPGPTPEPFGICPWQRELLEGLLGSTILGFHTQLPLQQLPRDASTGSSRRASTASSRGLLQGKRRS